MVGRERILAYLEEASPRDVNAWEIARRFDISQGAARQHLSRLFRGCPKEVYRTKRGWYAHVSALTRIRTPYEDFLRLGFHGLMAIADCHEQTRRGFRPIEPLVTSHYDYSGENPRNRSKIWRGDWGGRPLTIQLTNRGKLQVYLRASAVPLDLLDLGNYLRYLDEFFKFPRDAWVFDLEVNEDHEGRMHFVTGLSYRDAVSYVRVYWKEALRRMRVEVRKAGGFSLEVVLPSVERIIRALLELEKGEAK